MRVIDISFITKFTDCFTEGLSPYEFKKFKGVNIFGKLVNEEILQFITFQKKRSSTTGTVAFSIVSGIQTIYSYDLSPHQLNLSGIGLANYLAIDDSLQNRPIGWDIFECNEISVDETLKKALQLSILVAIKNMSFVTDLCSYINFIKMVRIDQLKFADKFFRDSVLLIKTNNHDSFFDVYKSLSDSILHFYNNNNHDPDFIEYDERIRTSVFTDIVAARDRVYNNPELLKNLEQEIEQRKKRNIEQLIYYGLMKKNNETMESDE